MPRVPTKEVAELLAQRLFNQGFEKSSLEWLTAWCRRWGARVSEDTEFEPLFRHTEREETNKGIFLLIGPDRVPLQIYREWRDLQDGSRTVLGTVNDEGAYASWED